jgi:hypothetical protein
MKQLIDDVLEMYSSGRPIDLIAEDMRVPLDVVEEVLEQYSNYWD